MFTFLTLCVDIEAYNTALQRQSAVTTQTKKQRKGPLKFLYQPVKHVMGRLCGNASPKRDIIQPRYLFTRQNTCHKAHYKSQLIFYQMCSYCTLPL